MEDVSLACASPSSSGNRFQRFSAASDGHAVALTSNSTVGHVLSGLSEIRTKLRSYVWHKDAVAAVAWHPQEDVIATGSLDRTIAISRLSES